MSRLPSTGPSLQRYLRQQARTAQRQQQSSAFALSGTSVTAEGVVTVDGELDINGPLAVHGTAAFDGNTTIGGNAAITGTLSLPAGIIGNDALTSPSAPQSIYATTNTYAVTTTETTRASVTVTVPAGFTAAVVNVMGRVDGRNGNSTGGWDAAGGDLLHTRAVIAGVPGIDMDLSVLGNGDHDVSVMPLATVLPGLTPGGTFVLAANVWSEYQNWPAHAKNIAEISGTITWYR
jgi:hypothetical protein